MKVSLSSCLWLGVALLSIAVGSHCFRYEPFATDRGIYLWDRYEHQICSYHDDAIHCYNRSFLRNSEGNL